MARNSQEPASPDSGRVRGICAAEFFAAAALILLLIAGCAAPGAPVTREPRVPRAISDLSARQSGDAIFLSFTFPTETAQGRKLSRTPAIEIYRAFAAAQASGGAAAERPQLAVTIPPQMTGKYLQDGEIRFTDALTPEEIAGHSGEQAVYEVRTRIGRRESADSNLVRIKIFSAPSAIEDLHAEVTQTAVELSWTAAVIPEGGSEAAQIRYRVYRAEVEKGNLPAYGAHGGKTNETTSVTKNEKGEPVLLGETSATSYSDKKFEFGQTYTYTVRSVAVYETGSVESAESNVLEVTPRDRFAPAAPTGLVATATGASSATAAHVDLSWAISSESDLQGYNVYRSESEDGTVAKLNTTALLTPAFRDDSVEAGKKYFYHVTAIDRAGNESAASAIVSVSVPASDDTNP